MSSRSLHRLLSRLPAPKSPPTPSMPALICGLFVADGTLVKVVEQPDPRETFSRTFNEMRLLDSDPVARPLNAKEAAAARKVLAERTVANV